MDSTGTDCSVISAADAWYLSPSYSVHELTISNMYHQSETTNQGANWVLDYRQNVLQGVGNQYEAMIDHGLKQLTNNH
jgi:hypothetical protein